MIAEELDSIVAAGELTGAVAIIWRDSQVVDAAWVGWQDTIGGRPCAATHCFASHP